MGLMQLMRPTANDMAEELGLEKYNILDPVTNVKFGSRYLKKCLKWFQDDIRLALASWNYGVGNIRRLQKMLGDAYTAIEISLPKETQNFVKKVLENYERDLEKDS